MDISRYKFTHHWFLGTELSRVGTQILDRNSKIRILEIGSYEGFSACYFGDIHLDHPESLMDCVDPYIREDPTSPQTSETESTFKANIAKCRNSEKITHHKMTSLEFFKTHHEPVYDFIYIDGSHLTHDVLSDMVHCFELVKPGGIMWMDDYAWPEDPNLKKVMDSFCMAYKSRLTIILVGYQLGVRKNF